MQGVPDYIPAGAFAEVLTALGFVSTEVQSIQFLPRQVVVKLRRSVSASPSFSEHFRETLNSEIAIPVVSA